MTKFLFAILSAMFSFSEGAVRGTNNVSEGRDSAHHLRRLMNDMNSGGGGSDGCTDATCPLELDQGSCLNAETVWNMYPEIQAETTLGGFIMECGPRGSCFAGQSQGCCRFTTGQGMKVGPYVCDANGYEFPAAVCICNEHTAPSRADGDGEPDGPDIPIPTSPPQNPQESCQLYTGATPPPNPYVLAGLGEQCTASTGCVGYTDADGTDRPACCVSYMCVCDREGLFLPSNTQCLA